MINATILCYQCITERPSVSLIFSEDIQIGVNQLPGISETVQNSEMAYIFWVCSLQKVVTVQLEVFFQPLLLLRLFSTLATRKFCKNNLQA